LCGADHRKVEMLLGILLRFSQCHSFKIDGSILKLDDHPFQYISGSFHYFRQHPSSWESTIKKMACGGLNAIQTYVPWNLHEPKKGEFNFAGIADIERFLTLCQQHNMYVILRPGPYICAEWDFGGLPSWLITEHVEVLRSMDPVFIRHVDDYFQVFLNKIKPFMLHNGGTIIMVQVENEFGAYFTCDHSYVKHLADLFLSILGSETVLFTTDQPHDYGLACGSLPPQVLPTLDFGVTYDASQVFERLGNSTPHINSEFYPGWLDHWNEPHHTVSTQSVVDSLEKMIDRGISVNFYMYFGGTNFGFFNGANGGRSHFFADPTSYDYDAPLSEAGDMTWKFQQIRSLIANKRPEMVKKCEVENTTKVAYGVFAFEEGVSLFDAITPKSIVQKFPKTFEQMGIDFGFVLYETTTAGGGLDLVVVHDRAHIFVNKQLIAIQLRGEEHKVDIPAGRLQILVENLGRINYGFEMYDEKGLVRGVKLDGAFLQNWTMKAIPLTNLANLTFSRVLPRSTPAFYRCAFQVQNVGDTFLLAGGFKKGVAFVNGFNVGRYWAVGPQQTLYVPAGLLHEGANELVLFEVDGVSEVGKAVFRDTAVLNEIHPP
jgi:beta-galactosidase